MEGIFKTEPLTGLFGVDAPSPATLFTNEDTWGIGKRRGAYCCLLLLLLLLFVAQTRQRLLLLQFHSSLLFSSEAARGLSRTGAWLGVGLDRARCDRGHSGRGERGERGRVRSGCQPSRRGKEGSRRVGEGGMGRGRGKAFGRGRPAPASFPISVHVQIATSGIKRQIHGPK